MANARNQRGSSQACHLPRVCRGAFSLQAPDARAQPLLHSAIRGVQTAHDVESVECLHLGAEGSRARSSVSIDGEAGQLPSGNAELIRSRPKAMPLAFFHARITCRNDRRWCRMKYKAELANF